MTNPRKHTIDQALADAVPAYRRHDLGAADRLCALLREPVSDEAAKLLGGDAADVVQQILRATLQYLDRAPDFSGDISRLATTIARNHCRDLIRWRREPATDPPSLADWLADPRRSTFDEVEQAERLTLLQSALGRLSTEHRALLRAMYHDDLTAESVRERLGLGTVHGVFYRRSVCLRQVKSFLNRRLHERLALDDADTAGYECIEPRLGSDLWRLEDPDTDAARRAHLETHVTFCASCRQQRAVESATEAGLRMGELALGSSAGQGMRQIRWLAGAGVAALVAGSALLLVHPAGWIVGSTGAAALVLVGVLLRRRRAYGSAL
jgi:RNA polymerase sigma-70 factor (ECF subfamily)